LWSGRVEEAGNDDRRHELEKAKHAGPCDFEELTPERFKHRRRFEQGLLHVGRGLRPKPIHRFADQRPRFDGIRREWNRENLVVESTDDDVDAADESKYKPSNRTDDNGDAELWEGCRLSSRAFKTKSLNLGFVRDDNLAFSHGGLKRRVIALRLVRVCQRKFAHSHVKLIT